MRMFALLLCISVSTAAFAEDLTLTKDDLLLILFGRGKTNYEMLNQNKNELIKYVREEFGVTDEDMAFLMSVRAARLPHDGFDFLQNPKELIRLIALYQEARGAWGGAIYLLPDGLQRKEIEQEDGSVKTVDFYDFFAEYASKRITVLGKGNNAGHYRDFYQLENARGRLKIP